MEQVVLHTSDDLCKGRNVGRKNTIAVHAPEFVRYTATLANNVNKDAFGFI